MKRFLASLFSGLFLVSMIFAVGSPEDQQVLFEQLPVVIKGQENQEPAAVSESSGTLTGNAAIERDMASLTRLYRYLEKNYLWDIDYNKAYEAMAQALFDSLGDKYTYYVTAERSPDYEEDTLGRYGGLGFYFTKTYLEYQNPEDISTVFCNIIQVFPNSPAARSGLLAGDYITHINGEDVQGLTSEECSARIKGETGTDVTITILRSGISFDLTITREQINIPSVVGEMLEDGIAYVQIIQFYSMTAGAFAQEVSNFSNRGMTALIMDLRNCSGGDVDAALAIADMFISNSNLLTIKYKDQSRDKTYKAKAGVSVSARIPVVILVNGNTASSSEILASTMKDNGRATLIGTKTYGKGIMQSVSSFGEGNLSVTVASLIPPSGNPFHETGIMPDIEVPLPSIQEDEIQAYSNLVAAKTIPAFVEEHPEYTRENVLLFLKTYPDTGISDEALCLLVRNSYYSSMLYDDQPKADVWFDPQVRAAMEYIRAGRTN